MKASDTFVDEVEIHVASGRGGDGCVGFRRAKFEPMGGPDGGDGGRGGDVVLVADEGENTLLSFRAKRRFRAQNGRPGEGNQCTGADGATIEIAVPVGTVVEDARDGSVLADLKAHGERWLAAKGGNGGWGNMRFKSATRRAPEFAYPGREGEERELRLSLKLLADVGLLGLPNAGKSTLIRAISKARPKVGAYPFTTLVPTLGVVERGDQRFVVADIPGLVEGASEGVGLGDRFLRHVERTRVLVHLLDLGGMLHEGRSLLDDYETVRRELGRYRPELLERTEIVVLNKLDLLPEDDAASATALDALQKELEARGRTVLRTSGATTAGTRELVTAMSQALLAGEEAS